MTTPVSEHKVSPDLEAIARRYFKLTSNSSRAELDAVLNSFPELIAGIRSLESQLAEAGRDTERWKWAKSGLFITPHPDHEIRVVYQSGMMDEVAQELYASLPKDERGIVWDVTPVFDKRAADSARGAPHE